MTRTSILVVQQQPELRRALQVGLGAGLYDVIAAGTGREAMALAARADDYLTKPFVMGALLARLRAKLRRQQGDVMQP